jgi:Protein of unknown function (DUF2012)
MVAGSNNRSFNTNNERLKMRLLSAGWLLAAALPTVLGHGTTPVTLVVPVTNTLPNPFSLPPNTHATLSTLHAFHSAPLTTYNTFVFHNVTAGSYLVDVHCSTYAFSPLRLDVAADLALSAWETYRGNDWHNKGEAIQLVEYDGFTAFPLRVLGAKNYFAERTKCAYPPVHSTSCVEERCMADRTMQSPSSASSRIP